MIKLVVMYARPKDPEHFKKHYIDTHLPLCRAIPGAMRVQYSFEPKTAQGAGEWFCIYEAEYADQDAMETAFATPEAKAAGADLVNYSEVPPTILVLQPKDV